MRVAAVQLASTQDTARNLENVCSFVTNAGRDRPDLVVLPEATQRSFGREGEPLASNSESVEGLFVETLCRLSKSLQVTIVAGMFETSPDPERPFNSNVVTSPSGLVGVYRKIHLYDAFGFNESKGVLPGSVEEENLCVVSVGEFEVGILTCFDLRFPEMARLLLNKGATVLALGAAWVPGARKTEQWRTLLSARAIETTCFVIAAAQPAPFYCGVSEIVHPDGHVLAKGQSSGDEIIDATLSLDELQAVRSRMPVEALSRIRPRSDE